MKGQTAIEYLMTYGWAILIILIVAGVLAYYGIFAPSGFLGPTARGFGQLQVLNPWSLSAATGILTLNVENRVGGTIDVTTINYTLTSGGAGTYVSTGADLKCTSGCVTPTVDTNLTSGGKGVFVATVIPVPTGLTPGSTYTTTVTIYYSYQGGEFSSTGTISGTYS
jgi:hypothetical protein